jgi:hypothetical protein
MRDWLKILDKFSKDFGMGILHGAMKMSMTK